jgi:DeoR/GlpR family transcriptional regulator of sugar metabolism
MNLNHRQKQILEQVQAQGEVKISELKQLFNVTEMTIRRDLEKLEDVRKCSPHIWRSRLDRYRYCTSGTRMDHDG